MLILKTVSRTSPVGMVDENPSANAGNMGSVPGSERFHMP